MITTNEIKLLFEQWWLLEGQYTCAGGQPSHKDVIFSAWLAGWDNLNRIAEVHGKGIEQARAAIAKAKGEA